MKNVFGFSAKYSNKTWYGKYYEDAQQRKLELLPGINAIKKSSFLIKSKNKLHLSNGHFL